MAGECEQRDGLHVCDDHFLPEIIDPATGAPRPPGQEGELVLTTLTKRAIPDGALPHRRRHDALTTEPCACGRTSARIARIKGRADDMLIIKGVNLYPSEVEATLLAVEELQPHYLLVVDRSDHAGPAGGAGGARARRCWSAAAASSPSIRRWPSSASRVSERLHRACGLTVELTIVAPHTIPRSEGKAVRVVERGVEKR